jgi:acetyl esterase
MVLDPEVQKWLQALASSGVATLETMSIEEAREAMRASSDLLGPGEPVARVEDRMIAGAEGNIPIRIYDPVGTGSVPAVIMFHGGGWVVGSIETHDAYCRDLANAAQLMVVSVDYRLAPEHRYPAAAEDAYAATKWIAEHGGEIGADGSRLATIGDSAGGNLATVVALMARDRDGPALKLQVLLYPIVDDNFDTDSYLRNMEGYHLTRDTMIWFWDQYAPEKSQRDQPYASPLQASNLADLPPALIVVAEYDPLLDEGEAYAKRLQGAGNSVQLLRYAGTIHGFARRTKIWPHARECLAEVAKCLRKALEPPAPAAASPAM